SCPCQPFSAAGKGGGFADERHLWPAFNWLIGQRRPDVIFGEQVASKNSYDWLDLVQTDLEGMGYACGPIVFPAAGVGAPHIRHRTYWVARLADAHSQQKVWSAVARQKCFSWADQPSIPLVADGVAMRMEQCRAYGNALCAPQAQAFIEAYLDVQT